VASLLVSTASSRRVDAPCDVRTRVHIRLKRRYVALRILAVELGLPRPIPDVLARVPRLESVLRVNVLNRDSRIFRLVLDATLQPSTGPTQASVHILPVVQRPADADIRQVFHHDDGVLKLFGVLHRLRFSMISMCRFRSYEKRSSTRHSEASRSWSRFSVVYISFRSCLASFPLMSNSSVGVSCWRAQPVTDIDSPISNPTRVGFSGSSDVSSISYSTVMWSVHVCRCFCKRSSPTFVPDSSSSRSSHSSCWSGFSRSRVKKLVPRPGCEPFQQISYSRVGSRSNVPARLTNQSGCSSSNSLALYVL
jgi:hypothetical protein